MGGGIRQSPVGDNPVPSVPGPRYPREDHVGSNIGPVAGDTDEGKEPPSRANDPDRSD